MLPAYWLYVGIGVLVILSLIFYKVLLRVLFGVVIVPEDRIGVVTKKFVLFGANKQLPEGRIIALHGEAGTQGQTLAPGLYFGKWVWQYSIEMIAFTTIPPGKLGLIIARDGAAIPTGRILASRVDCDSYQDVEQFLSAGGQRGRQSTMITAGVYRINRSMFEVSLTDITAIPDDQVGVITTLDGVPLLNGQIAGDAIAGHNNFQDFDKFISANGSRGLQSQVVLAGSYNLNPWAVSIELKDMTVINIGNVGVVISYFGTEGKDLTGASFKHGDLVDTGCKGVWAVPLSPGKYALNPYITKVEIVPTTNLVLNWASARTESHKLDANLSTITVRSKDGFPFNLDVSQIIHVPTAEAPKVITLS